MKKFVALICIIAAVFALCACSHNPPIKGEETQKNEGEILINNPNFTLTKLTGKDGIVKYNYVVTDENGKVLENALCTEEPRIALINKDLVGVRFTADGHSFSRYYDIQKGIISRSFKNAFWDNGVFVASNDYDNGHYFVIQDIFNRNGYCYKTEIESASWQITVIGSELSEDGTELLVTYVHGDGSDIEAELNTVVLYLVDKS